MNQWLDRNRAYKRLTHLPIREFLEKLKKDEHPAPLKKEADEKTRDRFLKISTPYTEAFNEIDYPKFQNVTSDQFLKEYCGGESPDACKKRFENEAKRVQEYLGKIRKIEMSAPDPPDGAFLAVEFERGAGEIFLVLDQQNKVSDLNLRITRVESDEHPEEHPEEDSEHPPEEKPLNIEGVAQFLESEVAARSVKGNGSMEVRDEKTGDLLKLKMVRIHRERLAKTAEGVYFVCADFETREGKQYDLDFWVTEKDGKLSITDTTIHKEAGQPRYLWIETGGIWTRKPL